MISSQYLLFIICMVTLGASVGVYFCCTRLGKRERKRFRHTSISIRERELKEVLCVKPSDNGPLSNGGHVTDVDKGPPKGQDFYAGRASVSDKGETTADTEPITKKTTVEPVFHPGMAKPRVMGCINNSTQEQAKAKLYKPPKPQTKM